MSEATRTAESKKDLYRQEIANLRETVKDLEEIIHVRLAEAGELDALRARVKELENVMPDPEMLRQLNIGYIELGLAKEGQSFVKLADRIEKVMKR